METNYSLPLFSAACSLLKTNQLHTVSAWELILYARLTTCWGLSSEETNTFISSFLSEALGVSPAGDRSLAQFRPSVLHLVHPVSVHVNDSRKHI